MTIDPNLFYKTDKINARGYHDIDGKCFILKAGSMGTICKNPKNSFFGLPTLLKFYEWNIPSNISSAGDDVQYYLQKDIRCYPTDNYDELSVASSLITGTLTKGNSVWKNEAGISVKKMNSSNITEEFIDIDNNKKRFDDATDKLFELISKDKEGMINILSLAYHLKSALGTKNEDRFIVPRQVDHCIAKQFNLLCDEEEAYDLRIPELDYTISDKMANDLFHQSTSKKVRVDIIKDNLQMSNTRSGQSSDNHPRPQFDCLLVMQYIPYLVCGIVPYYKIISNFRHTDGGWVLKKVSPDCFKYIISPTETISPLHIQSDIQSDIDNFTGIVQGGFLPNLLEKLPKCSNIPIPKSELW